MTATCYTLVLLLLPALLSAQQPETSGSPLQPHARIRVAQSAFRPRLLVGSLVSVEHSMLILRERRTGDTLTLPVSEIQRLQVSTGRFSPQQGFARGLKRGFLLGTATSVGLLALGAIADLTSDCADCMFSGTYVAAHVSVPIIALSSLGGAFWGRTSPPERWREFPLPVQRVPSAAVDPVQ